MLKKIIKFIAHREENYPNIQIFGYHFLKFIQKSFIKAKLISPQKNNRDMFNWSLYHLHYKGELKGNAKNYLPFLSVGDYEFTNNKLIKKNTSIKPLHQSFQFLYETILQLNPQSVFEMGCGTGVHLHNLQTLLPQARICGVDLSNQQLNGLKKTYPQMANSAKQADATVSWAKLPFEVCDTAFTQAVIMHIHTGDSHLTALENLFRMAKKYVILYESMKSHHFLNDIKKLHSKKRISWDNIFFYYRHNEEINAPMGLICSSTPLNYLGLKDYNIFSSHKKQHERKNL